MNPTERILDAVGNRAAEGLRTVEDLVRFAIDDRTLLRDLKNARHDVRRVVLSLGGDGLLASRDTPGDVGTTVSTASETTRQDLDAVAAAAMKRVQEALRTLEEIAKTQPSARDEAATIERWRYWSYTAEVDVSGALHRRQRWSGVRLYVLLTPSHCRRGFRETARAVLDAAPAVQAVQLRVKGSGEAAMTDAERLREAAWLAERSAAAGVRCVVNDRPDIARLANADGVHLGLDDLPSAAARKVVGPRCVIGRSSHSIVQAQLAEADGADVIAVGPIFASGSKPDANAAWGELGVAGFASVRAATTKPLMAIGGITPSNAGELIDAGCRCIVVGSAITTADDPAAVIERFDAVLQTIGN